VARAITARHEKRSSGVAAAAFFERPARTLHSGFEAAGSRRQHASSRAHCRLDDAQPPPQPNRVNIQQMGARKQFVEASL
jgi:hypothetical protein